MRKIVLVARREYMEHVRTKGFWIGVLGLPTHPRVERCGARAVERNQTGAHLCCDRPFGFCATRGGKGHFGRGSGYSVTGCGGTLPRWRSGLGALAGCGPGRYEGLCELGGSRAVGAESKTSLRAKMRSRLASSSGGSRCRPRSWRPSTWNSRAAATLRVEVPSGDDPASRAQSHGERRLALRVLRHLPRSSRQ